VNNFFDLMHQFEAQQKPAGPLCFTARFSLHADFCS